MLVKFAEPKKITFQAVANLQPDKTLKAGGLWIHRDGDMYKVKTLDSKREPLDKGSEDLKKKWKHNIKWKPIFELRDAKGVVDLSKYVMKLEKELYQETL